MTPSGNHAPRLDLLFKVLADRTRLRILHLLLAGEHCVGDLVEIIQVPQPTASRHLAYLRRSHWVRSRKEGPWIYYALAPAKGPSHARLLDYLKSGFALEPELISDGERMRQLKKRGGCCPSKANRVTATKRSRGKRA